MLLPHLNVLNLDRLLPEYQRELGMYKMALLTLKKIKKIRFVPESQGELGIYKAVLTLKRVQKNKSFCPRAREKTRNVQSSINRAFS
jgi:hypothetical protein